MGEPRDLPITLNDTAIHIATLEGVAAFEDIFAVEQVTREEQERAETVVEAIVRAYVRAGGLKVEYLAGAGDHDGDREYGLTQHTRLGADESLAALVAAVNPPFDETWVEARLVGPWVRVSGETGGNDE